MRGGGRGRGGGADLRRAGAELGRRGGGDPERHGAHRRRRDRRADGASDPFGLAQAGEPRPLPDPDAIVVAPATFNSINKWALGISDTLALGILCESYGWGVPVAVQPCLSAAQAAHPAYRESLAKLRRMGVRIADFTPGSYSWTRALDLLRD